MRIAVLDESGQGEPRVAASPETVKKYKSLGADVVIQKGAGLQSGIVDADYEAAGASIVGKAAEALKDADILLKVKRPTETEAKALKRGAMAISIMDPYGNEAALKPLADAGVAAIAMEFMPRITPARR